MATLYLLPNAVGDYTNLTPYPDTGEENYEDVDDPVGNPDDDSTCLKGAALEEVKDAYGLENTSQSGTINSVRVHFRIRSYISGRSAYARPGLRLSGNETAGTPVEHTSMSWGDYSEQLSRPGGGSWNWTDINMMQEVIGLWRGGLSNMAYCTQVYIAVDYTTGTNVTIDAPCVSIDSAISVPSMSLGMSLLPPLVAVDSSPFAPSLSLDRVFSAPLVSIDVDVPVPIVFVGALVECPLVAIDVSIFSPSLVRDTILNAPMVSVDIQPYNPVIFTEMVILAPIIEIDSEAPAPLLNIDKLLSVPVVAIDVNVLVPEAGTYMWADKLRLKGYAYSPKRMVVE